MARLILVTGGCRSGKSAFAQRLAESLPGKRAYLATAPIIDEEMHQRVERHRNARAAAAANWQTIETPIDLTAAVETAAGRFDVLLVDCLTLWINNLMFHADQAGQPFTEDDAATKCEELVKAYRGFAGTIIVVTNEVGSGLVPENALARRYRDLVGRANQVIAAAADAVHFVVSGIPLIVKGG
jgi:adenosylcobinamide kinase/adenosylcobinamide-phosphate guanylyltransferase